MVFKLLLWYAGVKMKSYVEQHQQSIKKQGKWFHVFSLDCEELTDVINATQLLLIQEDNAKFEVTEELASVEQL